MSLVLSLKFEVRNIFVNDESLSDAMSNIANRRLVTFEVRNILGNN